MLVGIKICFQNNPFTPNVRRTNMDKPKVRHVAFDVKTVTYFGDWIVNFEKTIQALAQQKASELPKVSSSSSSNNQMPQAQLRGNR